MAKRAVYPGTFDPLTNGHVDIIKRSLKIFDDLTILIAVNSSKQTLFTLEERIDQLKTVVNEERLDVKIDSFEGLVVDYCKENKIGVVVRGLRPLVDFEYEFEMAMTNRELNNAVETVFIITDQKYFYLRSSLVKDILKLRGDVGDKIPPYIQEELIRKLGENNGANI